MNDQVLRDLVFLRALVRQGHLWSTVAFMARWDNDRMRTMFLELARYRKNGWME